MPSRLTGLMNLAWTRVEKAIAAYNSPGYQEALKALGDGAVRDIRIIEGLD